jgi:predicted MPP superfamily phosphohydrolase
MEQEIDFRSAEGGQVIRLVWSTDLHFDAADQSLFTLYEDLVAAFEPDAMLIGGDISNGMGSFDYLVKLQEKLGKPLYFVLGNHDYYYGSIPATREHAKKVCRSHPSLHYLSDSNVIALSKTTALIGHDGWADGRAGNFLASDVLLNDYFLIDELKKLNHEERLSKLNRLGDEAAEYLRKQLNKALNTFERAVLLTHVPPFEEACLYGGVPADDDWAPHFVCKATGAVIEQAMKDRPDKELLVLCGHCHWGQDIQILPNLRVVTGHSELGVPNVQSLVLIN